MNITITTSKINTKGITFVLVTALTFLSIWTLPTIASDTASVTATVTVQNISVSVSDGSVSYGTLALNSSSGTNGTDSQTAQNDGNVTLDFNIRGQNTASWSLSGSAGSNQYVHRFCTTACDSAPTNYTALTTSYQTLSLGVAPSGSQIFDLYLTTPTSSSSYTQQSVDVTVQAVLP